MKTFIAFNLTFIVDISMIVLFYLDNDHPAIAKDPESLFSVVSSEHINMSVDHDLS